MLQIFVNRTEQREHCANMLENWIFLCFFVSNSGRNSTCVVCLIPTSLHRPLLDLQTFLRYAGSFNQLVRDLLCSSRNPSLYHKLMIISVS